jgi:hypothetical protein
MAAGGVSAAARKFQILFWQRLTLVAGVDIYRLPLRGDLAAGS